MNKRIIKYLSIIMALVLLVGCSSGTKESGDKESASKGTNKVMLYSSLKEEQLDALKTAFTEKYPEIEMDYYAAGTGTVATKLATEKQSGGIMADIVWIGDPSNYVQFKEYGILEAYESPEAKEIDDYFKDKDNYYVGARMVVMGLTSSTNLVDDAEVPKNWEDLLKPEFEGQVVMTDPGESGTTFYLVAGLMNHPDYGVEFFEKLKENGAELESGTTSTHTKVAANAYKVAIGVDYVSRTLIEEGSTLRFTYPEKDLVAVSSPIALLKDSPNPDNAKVLYDFILSKEGQEVLAAHKTTPVRKDVKMDGSLSIDEVIERALDIDDSIVSTDSKRILDEFDRIFK